MHCPKCHQPAYLPPKPCANCQFEGDPALIEELAHIKWLLNETDTWSGLGVADSSQQAVRQKYQARQREVEVALGLRLPPFTEAEARAAWPDLFQREALLEKVAAWLAEGLIDPVKTQTMVDQAQAQLDELRQQLEGHSRPDDPQTDADRLDLIDFLLEAVDYLRQNDGFTSTDAKAQILAPLLDEKAELEIKLGLRPEPEPSPEPEKPATKPIIKTEHGLGPKTGAQQPDLTPVPSPSAHESEVPRRPLGERIWRTLLSERTLQAMLFLGIFLLFSAAISFVVWGWQDFSAPLRVAIPTGFTAVFFGLGWYVRSQTPLYRSGIALSAIAALLIPIDFYTIYVNFNIPFEYWPLFWLATSLFCLMVYMAVTLIIGSRFFGYLVGIAAGSTVLASIELSHQSFGFSLDWRTAGLSLLAVGLILIAAMLDRRPSSNRWRVFSDPFRSLALLIVAVLLPLTFAWRFIYRDVYDTLHYALTLNWWLGGFIFGWGAVYYRSRSLGLLAAMALPVATYLAQAALFAQTGINPAWHGFGWAWLVPLYFVAGYKLSSSGADAIIRGHARTANGWGLALLIIAALWSLTDLTHGGAAASSHAILSGAVILAAFLWRHPRYLYGASLLALSATTFAMTELDLTPAQLSVGWSSLAIVHVVIGLSLGTRFPIPLPNYARAVILSGYTIAGLALLPPIFPHDGDLLVYALGNWLALCAWGARLAHTRQPGFVARDPRYKATFHWLTAAPLPIWLWLLFANQRSLDFAFPLALAALAWGMIALAYRLNQIDEAYRQPWYLTGGLVSIVAPLAAFIIVPEGPTPAIVLLAIGLLYFADAATGRQSGELLPAGLVTAWGYSLLLDRLGLPFEPLTLAITLLIVIYVSIGLWIEWRRSTVFTHQFLRPLYLTAHILVLFVLVRIYIRPLNHLFLDRPWTDDMRLWSATSQLLLAIVYGLYAWNSYREQWAHLAAWLVAASGGFIAITYSTGQGSSAAIAALLAIAFVLTERTLPWLRQHSRLRNRQKAIVRLAWRLYRRPLLVTGWTVSAGAIGLALGRNLWLLGGGRIQQIWAVVGLLLVTGLYALSARLFRQARFMWLAALLIFVPWTLLTNLGWFTQYRPTVPGFALSWIILAWLLYLSSLFLFRSRAVAYALPLHTVAHILLPVSLLWGIADTETSRFTVGLAIGLYGLAAWLDYRRYEENSSILATTRFLYPALGLIPLWAVYLMAWRWPAARHEHFGLMLLIFAPLGLLAGHWFERIAPRRAEKFRRGYGLPAYLTGYVSLVVGTMLVAHLPALLALVLLFDAVLMLISARLFKNPLWIYPAAVLIPISLLFSLYEAGIPGNRHGWWLIGLAAVYLGLSWTLRRLRLPAYSTVTLVAGFALIALGLPPSSQDQIGALGGYAGAAILYTLTAFWLKQPLLLTPASALAIVPYAVALQRSLLPPPYYGLSLFPGAVIALAAGWSLDAHFGTWRDFPWGSPARWPTALADRLLGWWGLPLYGLGFGLAMASPLFTEFRVGLTALNFLLLMPIFGWAIYRFRLRIWLLALVLAGHLAAIYELSALSWWQYPAWAWLRFLPVTIITAVVALVIQRFRKEGPPLDLRQKFRGWSHPLYALLFLDISIAQLSVLEGTWAATTVTLTHTLLITLLASVWLSSWLTYASLTLGAVALGQWLGVLEVPLRSTPIPLAQLAFAYGLVGYGLALLRSSLQKGRRLQPWLAIWELPLQRFSIGASFLILFITGLLGLDLVGWTIRAMLGLPFRSIVDAATVWMVIGVLSFLGLLYLTAAFTHRWLRLGYLALGMLVASWTLYALYIQQWDNFRQVQWYAIPVGLYLLLVGFFEWERGSKTLGRWLDYAALLLMIGSLFWQTALFGWEYALLLGAEGFSAFWWGSARRLRRFFYAGMVGVMLTTLGQLINSLRSINQWIVFGTIGLLLVILAVFVERKLEDIKLWQEKILETWE